MYHPWCALIHFSIFVKCVDPLCEQVLHDNWWLCSEIKKLGLEKDFGGQKGQTKTFGMASNPGAQSFLICGFVEKVYFIVQCCNLINGVHAQVAFNSTFEFALN